ncbi:MAG TPA: hypothetical protein VMP01_05265 [Pirellulaceae bacterium]|nr:hypothetical protein [Pirellulaceae bacterium]
MVAPSRYRLQFSLRWLFVVVTAIAVCALVYRITGLVESIGVAVAFVLCGICINLPPLRFRRSLRGILLALAAGIVWMVGVDYSYFWEGCGYCRSHWNVEEVRVFHQPVWSRQSEDHLPSIRLIAEDLGAPCPHRYERWHLNRLWGFLLLGPPNINGTCCLAGGDWYVHADRDYVRAIGARDPKIGVEFQKALIEHDHKTLKRLLDEVRPPPSRGSGVK